MDINLISLDKLNNKQFQILLQSKFDYKISKEYINKLRNINDKKTHKPKHSKTHNKSKTHIHYPIAFSIINLKESNELIIGLVVIELKNIYGLGNIPTLKLFLNKHRILNKSSNQISNELTKNIINKILNKYISITLSSRNVHKLYVIIDAENILRISTYVSLGFKYIKNITTNNVTNNIYVYKYTGNTYSGRVSKNILKQTGKLEHKTKKLLANILLSNTKDYPPEYFMNGYQNGYQNSFIISGKKDMEGLDFTSLRKDLSNIGLYEVIDNRAKPVFMWLEQLNNNKFDTRYYNTECFIMNILSSEKNIIANKYQLYINFNKYFPKECEKYMAKSWNFTTFLKHHTKVKEIIHQNTDDTHFKYVYIVRPVGVGAFSGKDIFIVYNKKTLDNSKKIIGKYENTIISNYITNPMLFEGRKFHLRTYFLVATINGKYKTYFYELYELFTAEKQYNNNDFLDKDIHDTHFKSTPRDIQCPYDLEPDLQKIFNNKIYPKMQDCMFYISKMMEKYTIPYPQSKNAFEVFGCDFLVKDNYDVILMEINDKTGFTMHKIEKKIEFSKRYFNVINDLIIQPYLGDGKYKSKLKWLYES